MKNLIKRFFLTILFFFTFSAFAQGNPITDLADKFVQATDLARAQIKQDYVGKEIEVEGVIFNVEDYNFFDEKKDNTEKYYRVTTDVQKTPNNVSYQVVFLYKDLEKVKDLVRGGKIEKTGKIVKIIDEGLQISIWILDGELTDYNIS